MISKRARRGLSALCAASTLAVGGAAAANDSCREWQYEHEQWMTEVVRLYLAAAPQAELDAAVFELLQREAYLTSCDVSVEQARGELVGWRLVGRAPEEYASAVLETLLDSAGFDLDLRARLQGQPPGPPARYARGAR